MKEKTVILMLICLVALSIVYSCTGIAFSSHTTPTGPTRVTEEKHPNVKPSYPEPNLNILGDPIDNPRPHNIGAYFK